MNYTKNMSGSKKLKVNKKRNFSAHHMLIGAARMALEDAKAEEPGWYYSQLITITFCALSIEAIGNAFGKQFVEGWDDFETSSPIAKLRIICERLDIDANFSEEPWSSAVWLVRLRNKIAHAKPQIIDVELVMSRDEYDKKRSDGPKSKIENQINLGNAIKAFETVEVIKDILCDNIPEENQFGLRSDGWQGSASL